MEQRSQNRRYYRGALILAAIFTVSGGAAGILTRVSSAGAGSSAPSAAIRAQPSGTTGPSSSLVPASTPSVNTIPSSDQSHYVAGPFISEGAIESMATQLATNADPAPVTVISAKLESVAAASQDVGLRVASFYTGDDRMVWLVWLDGPYVPSCITNPCPAAIGGVYFMVFDATTGDSLGVGRVVSAPGMPSAARTSNG